MKKYFIVKNLKTKGYIKLNEVIKDGKVIAYTVFDYCTKKEAQRFPYVNDKEAYNLAKKYIWGKIEIELIEE